MMEVVGQHAPSAPQAVFAPWRLIGASLHWADPTPAPRSADGLYRQICGRDPQVSLRGRLPTFSLPCRELARGMGAGLSIEVSVQGHDYASSVVLAEGEEPGPLLEALQRAIDATDGIDGAGAWRTLTLDCRATGLPAADATGLFCAISGVSGSAATAFAAQSYRRCTEFAGEAVRLAAEMEVSLIARRPAADHLLAVELALTANRDVPHDPLASWENLLDHGLGELQQLGIDLQR